VFIVDLLFHPTVEFLKQTLSNFENSRAMIKGKKLHLLDPKFTPENLTDDDLKQIKKVYLEKTRLTELHTSHIELFPKISHVAVLHFNENKLMNIPNEIEIFSRLKRLYLHNNMFQRLPIVLYKLVTLGNSKHLPKIDMN
jgi:hypothetical protein